MKGKEELQTRLRETHLRRGIRTKAVFSRPEKAAQLRLLASRASGELRVGRGHRAQRRLVAAVEGARAVGVDGGLTGEHLWLMFSPAASLSVLDSTIWRAKFRIKSRHQILPQMGFRYARVLC